MNTDILFADNLDDMISGSFDRYCTHALCREGEASFLMTGEWFRMRKGDCVIFTHNELISKIEISDDFQVTVLYISNSFSFKNIPRNDYDVIGKLTLLRNPIMSLTEREQRIFMEDIELIRRRLTDHTHRFHDELIGCLAKTFVLDLYDFHARIYESPSVSEQNAVLMERFINLLKAGDYRNHREVFRQEPDIERNLRQYEFLFFVFFQPLRATIAESLTIRIPERQSDCLSF